MCDPLNLESRNSRNHALPIGTQRNRVRSAPLPGEAFLDCQGGEFHTGTMIHVRIAVMSNSGLSVGDRVTRVNDGTVGVIVSIGPGTDVGVRWEPSGVIQSIVPHLLKPA